MVAGETVVLRPTFSALLAADHPLSNRGSVTGQHLEPYPLLALAQTIQEDIYQRMTPLLEQAGIRSTLRVNYPTMQSVWTLVAAGRGWTLTSSQWGKPPRGHRRDSHPRAEYPVSPLADGARGRGPGPRAPGDGNLSPGAG